MPRPPGSVQAESGTSFEARRVRKGEHGVKVVTMLTTSRETTDAETGGIMVNFRQGPWATTVFDLTQTDPQSSAYLTPRR